MVTEKKVLYPELSYKIVGCAFEVFNEIGPGHKELTYQKAMKAAFDEARIMHKDNLYWPIKFKSVVVEKGFFDFSVEDKIVVELKARDNFLKKDFEQLNNYLVNAEMKLGILICFGSEIVVYKRVLNTVLLNQEKVSGTSSS